MIQKFLKKIYVYVCVYTCVRMCTLKRASVCACMHVGIGVGGGQ